MATLNISLPDGMKEFVEEQVTKGDTYNSASDYVRDLIRRDQKHQAREKLEALLLEGLDSGPPIEVNEAWWEEKKTGAARTGSPEVYRDSVKRLTLASIDSHGQA